MNERNVIAVDLAKQVFQVGLLNHVLALLSSLGNRTLKVVSTSEFISRPCPCSSGISRNDLPFNHSANP